LFRSYILKFYVISKPLFVLFDLIKYPDLDSVCTCLWVDGASVGTQKEGKMYRKRGGLRECLTIPSTNSNVNRVRVHPLLASETNEGYTFILHGSGKHPLQGYSASAPDVPASQLYKMG